MAKKVLFFVVFMFGILFGGCAMNQPEQKDIEVTQTSRGALLTISERLLFDFGKSTVKPEADEVLSKIADIVNTKTKKDISIEGHTDSIGSSETNKKLSIARAQTIKNILISKGVASSRIHIVGYGATRPKADNSSEDGRRLNRRTEIYLLGEDKSVVDNNIFAGLLVKLKNMFD